MPTMLEKLPTIMEQGSTMLTWVLAAIFAVIYLFVLAHTTTRVIVFLATCLAISPLVLEKLPAILEKLPAILEKLPTILEKVPAILEEMKSIIEVLVQHYMLPQILMIITLVTLCHFLNRWQGF
ncbi:hypothetical protein B0H67DRAFT_571515 [Lasiosphaeris hirsuta]|uniref:Uncharacterized protein n=1 Tax=Lasiosphaeris hirsuta TaxID=260670 RepID=A0AA40B157_9PEZI|nr:hypothetical protein B0H67DRAFT_571515 [Lasiosphaeris hirsuta]